MIPEPPPEQNRDLARINRCLRDICRFLPSLRVIPKAASGSVSKTSLGQIVKFKGGGGGVAAASSSAFKGEWLSTYTSGDVTGYGLYNTVLIIGGTNAGYYMSLQAANTDPPYNSPKWVQLASNNTVGEWT